MHTHSKETAARRERLRYAGRKRGCLLASALFHSSEPHLAASGEPPPEPPAAAADGDASPLSPPCIRARARMHTQHGG